MIIGFKCKETQEIFAGRWSSQFPPEIQPRAKRKLDSLNAAVKLSDLRSPGNQLEALKGKLKGQYSIRINDQWRICFCWLITDVDEVEIKDYH